MRAMSNAGELGWLGISLARAILVFQKVSTNTSLDPCMMICIRTRISRMPSARGPTSTLTRHLPCSYHINVSTKTSRPEPAQGSMLLSKNIGNNCQSANNVFWGMATEDSYTGMVGLTVDNGTTMRPGTDGKGTLPVRQKLRMSLLPSSTNRVSKAVTEPTLWPCPRNSWIGSSNGQRGRLQQRWLS